MVERTPYRFRFGKLADIVPSLGASVHEIQDSTPRMIAQFATGEVPILLAQVRYNRLIDDFLQLRAHSLDNHLHTRIPNYGPIQIDELYVGTDGDGGSYVIPVQAVGKTGKPSATQTIRDTIYCANHEAFKPCQVRAVSAQALPDRAIALFEMKYDGRDVSVLREKHYHLLEPSGLREGGLLAYPPN